MHEGHLTLAREVRDRFSLDRLIIVPAPHPPHKRQPLAPFAHRAAMLESALTTCADCAGIVCSQIEQELPKPSYTIHTVETVMRLCGAQRFYLVIGMDSLADLRNWYRCEDLLALIDLIVVNREKTAQQDILTYILNLPVLYQPDPCKTGVWRNQAGKTLELLLDFHMPYSSTAIRTALSKGEQAAGLPAAVRAYIHKHGLYSG